MGADKIKTFLARLKAQRALVERFLSGALVKEDVAGMEEAAREVGLVADEEDPLHKDVRFNERQARLEKGIWKLLDVAKAAREPTSDRGMGMHPPRGQSAPLRW